MLDKKSLGVEDKAMRPEVVDEDTIDLPCWRCKSLACRWEFPPGKRPPGRCPGCGAAVEVVPPKGE